MADEAEAERIRLETEALEEEWVRGLQKKHPGLRPEYSLDTPAGVAQELKNILKEKDVKTQDRLRALDQLAELHGFKRFGGDADIRRMSQEELGRAMREVVVPAVRMFLVPAKKGALVG